LIKSELRYATAQTSNNPSGYCSTSFPVSLQIKTSPAFKNSALFRRNMEAQKGTEAPFQKPYRVLIADELPVVRRGLCSFLHSRLELEICGEASNRPELLELLRKTKPDLIIMGLTMHQTNGLEGIRSVGNAYPGIRILVFTANITEDFIRRALDAGAHGCVLKSDSESDLLSAIEHLTHKRVFYTSRALNDALKSMTRSFIASKSLGMPQNELTGREIEVVALLTNGNSNKEAAAKLNLSTRTVEAHRNHVMKKLRLSNFSELVRFAIRHGIVQP
jgi:two-component system response regulator NreC